MLEKNSQYNVEKKLSDKRRNLEEMYSTMEQKMDGVRTKKMQ